MFDISLKVSGSTKKGIALKRLAQIDVPNDQPISSSNACTKCVIDVKEINDTIQCSKCSKSYHTTCLTHPIPSDFTTMQAKNPCLWWLCMACVLVPEKPPTSAPSANIASDGKDNQLTNDAASKKRSAPSAEQVDVVNNISKQLLSFKSELMENINDVIERKLNSAFSKLSDTSSSVSTAQSYADMARPANKSDEQNTTPCVTTNKEHVTETAVSTPEVLILSPKPDLTVSDVLLNKVKKSVENKLKKLQVEFVRPNSNTNKIAVGFKNSDLRAEAESLLNSNDDIALSGYTCKSIHKMLPKISLINVSSDVFDEVDRSSEDEELIKQLEKQSIIDKILDKNDAVKILHSDEEHTLQVVYLKKVTEHQYTIVLKVSPAIRAALINQGRRIYIGSTVYYFTDRFHVQQCYHCQKIGHTSGKCPDIRDDPVCMYCMGRHYMSSKCSPTIKKNHSIHRCARCLASPHGNDAELGLTHNAASPNCPLIKRELKRLEQNTNFTSKNVM